MMNLLKTFLLILICVAAIAKAETLVLTEDDAAFFHHVMCASDSAANVASLEVEAETYRDDIAKLKKLANESRGLAIASGGKANRKETYVLQFIELKTQTAIEANNRFIQKRGFETFAKVAASSIFKMCKVQE